MLRRAALLLRCGLTVCGALHASHAFAAPVDELHAVLADHARWLVDADPIGAGLRGDAAAAARWPDVTPTAVVHRTAVLRSLSERLAAISPEALNPADTLNRRLLAGRLRSGIEAAAFDVERMPFSSDEGFFTAPAEAAETTRLRTQADIDAWLARLSTFPAWYDAEIANMRRGMATGFVQPRSTVLAAVEATRSAAETPAESQTLMTPLQRLPATLPAARRERALVQGLALVRERVLPAERRLADFFADEYLPRARPNIAASSLPNGRAYYAWRVRSETTTNLTPDEVAAIGRTEIARIRGAMDAILVETGFRGTFAEFLAFLRSSPQFHAASPDDLLARASRLAKLVDDQLPSLFGKLPRLPYGVRPVPAAIAEGYTSARYNEGSPEQGVAGGLMINTTHLDQRPLYELPALVAHEGVPGHHLQIALAQELPADVPLFRRNSDLTAFVEGWALYAERLVADIGLYRTPYERFGQLSMEMWRACRLVVDVGIHWSGMSRDDAVACLRDNTALAEVNIQNEVNRYISWPGQALGYKIGQMKYLELRAGAEAALGPRFDVRRFHDLVLDEGVMPLDVLSQRVDEWVAAELRR